MPDLCENNGRIFDTHCGPPLLLAEYSSMKILVQNKLLDKGSGTSTST